MSDQSLNYFSMLGVPRQFRLDESALTSAYRELQRSVHPDRFAGKSDRERRLAVQKSSQINEAYETLRSVTRRAAYLLSLAGHHVDTRNTTFRDPEFLMQQMQLREELSDLHNAADPEAALDTFYTDVDRAMDEQKAAFEAGLDSDVERAKEAYAKLQFLEKLRTEAEQKEGELLDY